MWVTKWFYLQRILRTVVPTYWPKSRSSGLDHSLAHTRSLVCIGGVSVGSCGTHIVFGCIHYTVHLGFFNCCSLVVTVPSVGGWVQIPVCSLL